VNSSKSNIPDEEIYDTIFPANTIQQSSIYRGIHFTSINYTGLGIVLTPECDILNKKKANTVLMAQILPAEQILNYFLEEDKNANLEHVMDQLEKSKEKAKLSGLLKEFSDLYLKNRTFSYYFLPKLQASFGHSLVHFPITQNVPTSDLVDQNKICLLKSPFRAAVPVHYATYIGRIGTPDFKDDFFLEVMLDLGQCLKPLIGQNGNP
jgi:hypothetical protein